METTKYDTIINFFLDNWIIATIVVIAVVIIAIPQLQDGLKLITKWVKPISQEEPSQKIESLASNYTPCTIGTISKGSRVRNIDDALFQKYGVLTVDQIKGEYAMCVFGGYSRLNIHPFKISELTKDGISYE